MVQGALAEAFVGGGEMQWLRAHHQPVESHELEPLARQRFGDAGHAVPDHRGGKVAEQGIGSELDASISRAAKRRRGYPQWHIAEQFVADRVFHVILPWGW